MIPRITPTMEKFGWPETRIGETEWWALLFRRKQVTLGALVLAAKCEVAAFAELPPAAFADLGVAVALTEKLLSAFVSYERINYLMLMMVDPHPHFHVLPRYSSARSYGDVGFPDAGWPGPPALDRAIEPPREVELAAIAELRALFGKAGRP